jgi:hypothetical protein
MCPDQLNILSASAVEAGTPSTFLAILAKTGQRFSLTYQKLSTQ